MRPDRPDLRSIARVLGVPVAVAAVSVVGTLGAAAGQPDRRALDAAGVALLLVGPAVLVVRERRPALVYALTLIALLTYWGAGYPFGPVVLAPLVALATAMTTGRRRSAGALTVVAVLAGLGLYLLQHPTAGWPVTGLAAWIAWLVAFIAGCELWRARGQRSAQARVAREEGERRRATEERLRAARELHDALGHHVSLINVQAGVALYLIDDDPEQARTALAVIKQASGDLLGEMRATLGVLRGVDEDPPRQAVAGLARLDELAADNRRAGLPVTVERHGVVRDLPTGVDGAAYRIVQESLTNTRRHADARTATVTLTYTDDELIVQIDDDGPPTVHPPAPGGGTGLAGMRERAVALGGTLDAGSRPDGGFRVRGRLPLTPTRTSSGAGAP